MWWRRFVAMLLAFALVAAACGDDDDDEATDPVDEEEPVDEQPVDEDPVGEGDDPVDEEEPVDEEPVDEEPGDAVLEHVQRDPVSSGLLSPAVCVAGEESAPLDDLIPVEAPDLAGLAEYSGPVYRPGMLVGPPDFDPASVDGQLQLERIEVPAELEISIDGEPRELGDQVALINDTLWFWWIASAASEELLDPVNYWASTGFDPDGLAPVPVLIPNGGHQYGPSGPAAATAGGYQPEEVGGFDGWVGIIDTSFKVEPDGLDDSVVGHGGFIREVLRQMLPNAQVRTVDMGPEGQNLAAVAEPSVKTIYANDSFGLDLMMLLFGIAGLKVDDVTVAAVNMSFGTYSCGDENVAPAHLERALDPASGSQVFAAAGNDQQATPWWPAAFSAGDPAPNLAWVHGVGGLDQLDADSQVERPGEWADFSNHGEWVTTCEEGEAITVTFPSDSIWTWSGTSFAAPQAMARSLGDEAPSNPAACPARS